ncbi:hypothetical protein [Fimbriiglobus ruber]|uniref:Uncharacterized protein n=1 Tax=Fimbriiglobus ruber TaxID=1908690 RepID=A0A225D0W7_9BACT|nr:hypothetical protein [Fimbriiglobus ruber]OWK35241.1 hypothetical protein FRUB_09402 [Fimbriiglobus ruber]
MAGVLPVRRIALIGLGVGAVTAAVSYVAPHGLSATLAGAGGAATAVGVQVGVWARDAARRLGLA